MNNHNIIKKKKGNADKYFLTDIAGVTLTLMNGESVELDQVFVNKLVLIDVLPKSNNPFIDLAFKYYKYADSVEELAELCGYSCVKTFNDLFKENFNITPKKWFLKHKMEAVHALVVESDIPFFEIAKMYKFKSYSNFSNNYKNCFGVRPSESRKSVHKTK